MALLEESLAVHVSEVHRGGHGRAGKPEVARIVARLLGTDHNLASDASDAAAIAITHLMHNPFQRMPISRRAH